MLSWSVIRLGFMKVLIFLKCKPEDLEDIIKDIQDYTTQDQRERLEMYSFIDRKLKEKSKEYYIWDESKVKLISVNVKPFPKKPNERRDYLYKMFQLLNVVEQKTLDLFMVLREKGYPFGFDTFRRDLRILEGEGKITKNNVNHEGVVIQTISL